VAEADNNTAFNVRHGTSYAAPTAAGVAATALQTNPNLSIAALKSMVLDNASAVTIVGGLGVANRVLFSNFLAPPPPPPPLTSVSMTGPTSVRSGTLCVWFANPNGGTAPFSWVWKKNGSTIAGATSSQVETSFSSSGTLQVIVTDATGTNKSNTKSISVSPSAPLCQL
jgi:hypothetical protein